MTPNNIKIISGIGCILFTVIVLNLVGCRGKETVGSALVFVPVADSLYIKMGNNLVAATFDTLRNSLIQAISEHGLDGAISFCNEKAYPLTDMYADTVTIRRTSIRFRNPDNRPDSLELKMLLSMEQKQLENGHSETEIIRDQKSELVHFFKPIIVQPMCLNCHGKRDRFIQHQTLQRIQQLYPGDLAIDYEEGDFRGLWHVIFNSRKN